MVVGSESMLASLLGLNVASLTHSASTSKPQVHICVGGLLAIDHKHTCELVPHETCMRQAYTQEK